MGEQVVDSKEKSVDFSNPLEVSEHLERILDSKDIVFGRLLIYEFTKLITALDCRYVKLNRRFIILPDKDASYIKHVSWTYNKYVKTIVTNTLKATSVVDSIVSSKPEAIPSNLSDEFAENIDSITAEVRYLNSVIEKDENFITKEFLDRVVDFITDINKPVNRIYEITAIIMKSTMDKEIEVEEKEKERTNHTISVLSEAMIQLNNKIHEIAQLLKKHPRYTQRTAGSNAQ